MLPGAVAAFVAAGVIGFALPQVQERLQTAVAEFGRFDAEGSFKPDTSVGIRLELSPFLAMWFPNIFVLALGSIALAARLRR